MRKFSLIFVISLLLLGISTTYAEEGSKKQKISVNQTQKQFSLEITITDIPKNQQTLFVPIKIDSKVLDFDKVALEGLSTQNILAVASSSKDKVGTGIGLLKFDENGLPSTLKLKVLLKPVASGQTEISLLKVADEPALLSRGGQIYNDIKVSIKGLSAIDVTETLVKAKKKLLLSQAKLTIEVQRPAQKEETIFIPVIFDSKIADLDETFGHSIIAQGITAKTFSSTSLHEGGPGVEIVLSDTADKDFTVDIDLAPKGVGTVSFSTAFPQNGHTAIVKGPIVNISPTLISVVNNDIQPVEPPTSDQ